MAETEEMVEVSTLEVGNKVWIPNSRHSQAIIAVEEDGRGNVRLKFPSTTWVLTPTTQIRKDISE